MSIGAALLKRLKEVATKEWLEVLREAVGEIKCSSADTRNTLVAHDPIDKLIA